jgi:putative DNA primase/helicase
MSPAVQRLLAVLEAHGRVPRRSGAGWMAPCPVHDDRNPSLSISEGQDGRALVYCHTGCDRGLILEALGLQDADLFERNEKSTYASMLGEVLDHDYQDAEGKPVLRVSRRLGPDGKTRRKPDGGKDIWRTYRFGGKWCRSKDVPNGTKPDTRDLLYNLPAVIECAKTRGVIHVGEGELVVDELTHLGFVATTNVGGASQSSQRPKWNSRHAKPLRGASNLVIWQDRDGTGEAAAAAVAATATTVGIGNVKVIAVASASGITPDHYDVADLIRERRSARATDDSIRTELQALVDAAPEWKPAGSQGASEPASGRAQRRGPTRSKRRSEPQGSELGLNDDEPCEDVVDGAALLADIAGTLKRFIVLSRAGAVAIVLWIVLTYLTDHVEVLPRLQLSSPTKACGKTRLLTLITNLVRRAMAASSATAAAIFRAIDAWQPTIMLDEIDNARLKDNEEFRAIINSGYTRGSAYVLRTEGDSREPRRFSTWAAMAFAGIGRLPDTVESRSVHAPMIRKKPSERVERLREARLMGEFEPLRRRLARWAQDYGRAIGEADPHVPDALGDRDADNWRPLIAIADQVGGEWPKLARGAALELSGVADEDASAVLLLADIRDYFETEGTDRATTKEVLAYLGGLETRPWPEWSNGKPITGRSMAKLLKDFGIEPRTIRLDEATAKGYSREWFEDAWARYLPPHPSPASPTAPIVAETPFSDPSPDGAVTDAESGFDPRQSGPVTEVTDTGQPVGADELSAANENGDEDDVRRREAEFYRSLGSLE